nr:Peroxisomal fatty acid beta-oxidation multifunctional protein [Ipomoea batatas]
MGGNGKLVTMEIGSDGIAVITLSNPPVNALTLSVIAEMKEHYREAMERDDVKGVVLTGTGGKFCGGLDVNILQKVHSTDQFSLNSGNLKFQLPDRSRTEVWKRLRRSSTAAAAAESMVACSAVVVTGETSGDRRFGEQ